MHQLEVSMRQNGRITGVTEVISFDNDQIQLETTEGMLTIQGSDLHVNRLHIEDGEIEVNGKIDSLIYKETGAYRKKQKGSLFKRMFA